MRGVLVEGVSGQIGCGVFLMLCGPYVFVFKQNPESVLSNEAALSDGCPRQPWKLAKTCRRP
jgi:hypothetical protein